MTSTPPNLAASVMSRLKNEARKTSEPFNIVLDRYVGLRLMYRLSTSQYGDKFYLKGATMFLVWNGSTHRPTRDIDLLGLVERDEKELHDVFQEICRIDCPEDGVSFDANSIVAERIREEQSYGGIRIRLTGFIGSAKIPIQVDVGYGDAVTPDAPDIELPRILPNVPPPKMKGYPAETVISEKLQAMVQLGLGNSRMKDLYDVAMLAGTMQFDRRTLAIAIRATFDRRSTLIPKVMPAALSNEFLKDQQVGERWKSFVQKNTVTGPYSELKSVQQQIRDLVIPVMKDAQTKSYRDAKWQNGEWR